MPKNNPNKDRPQVQQGQKVIEEAARLLGQVQFSQDYGAYAEGHHVAVSIDPRWNTDHETIRVLIACSPFGHRGIDWASLPIQILPKNGRVGVHALARLN